MSISRALRSSFTRIRCSGNRDSNNSFSQQVFTPRKGDEGGGKGKGGKGKGGKGKGQVTIIAPESADDDDRRHRDRLLTYLF